MQASLKALTRLMMRVLFKPVIGSRLPLRMQRRWLALVSRLMRRPRDVGASAITAGGVPTVRLRAAAVAPRVGPAPMADRDAILFVHGGGFILGGGATYRGFAAWVAEVTGADVYLADYRLAPEHPSPAPGDDLFAAYAGLLGLGHSPERLAVLGDSAGGALAASLALTLPEMGVPSPAALVLLSPWLDLSLSGASITGNARRDPMLRRRFLDAGGRAHAGRCAAPNRAFRRSSPTWSACPRR